MRLVPSWVRQHLILVANPMCFVQSNQVPRFTAILIALIFLRTAWAQTTPKPVHGVSDAPLASEYVLGPEDRIVIRALDIDEFDGKPTQIDVHGFVDVPLLGHVRAAGLTAQELQSQVTEQLSKYVRAPVVTVTVEDFVSQPVSVVGAVAQPGIYHLNGQNTLIEVLSQARGLSQDAGDSINITRKKSWGRIPLPSCRHDLTGDFYTASIDTKRLFEARDPSANIEIKPDDVVAVPKAEMVYVVGAVNKAGAFVLSQRQSISVLQALSMAEGLDKTAAGGRAKIIRHLEKDQRVEIPADLNKILSGKASDSLLMANDILFVPNSGPKSASLRAIEAAIQVGTGVVIYRR